MVAGGAAVKVTASPRHSGSAAIPGDRFGPAVPTAAPTNDDGGADRRQISSQSATYSVWREPPMRRKLRKKAFE
jgi:hypothetical protein